MDLAQNAERFSGFADLYDRVRPTPPTVLADIVCTYAGIERPEVVDLGSGSGLSTRWIATLGLLVSSASSRAPTCALSPSARTMHRSVSFVDGWAHDTGLPDDCADIVIVSQALHWMEPSSTFAEVGAAAAAGRGLRGDGLRLAALGRQRSGRGGVAGMPRPGEGVRRSPRSRCAWRLADCAPPFEHHTAAAGFARDAPRGRTMSAGVRAWSKDEHLGRMVESGVFSWCREVVVSHTESGDG